MTAFTADVSRTISITGAQEPHVSTHNKDFFVTSEALAASGIVGSVLHITHDVLSPQVAHVDRELSVEANAYCSGPVDIDTLLSVTSQVDTSDSIISNPEFVGRNVSITSHVEVIGLRQVIVDTQVGVVSSAYGIKRIDTYLYATPYDIKLNGYDIAYDTLIYDGMILPGNIIARRGSRIECTAYIDGSWVPFIMEL